MNVYVMNIYIGNLSHEVTDGQVTSAKIIKDKFSGVSRGFGFVDMPVKSEAHAVITGLNGKELKGQALTVNETPPRSEGRQGGRRPSWQRIQYLSQKVIV